ncbi:MAG: response regulator [Hyphomicrobiales bacterium]|nr:MAG: response regulator [Hyphomicrobiales bacterium]
MKALFYGEGTMGLQLEGANILIVEDEPLIALDIATALKIAGATVTTTNSLKNAKVLVEHDGLSAAILDHVLHDGDSGYLCQRLTDRKIPFLIYSGLSDIEGPCRDAPHIAKPDNMNCLVAMTAQLLQQG